MCIRDRTEGRMDMLSADAPIGVMDAGFGGYTVIRELQKLLPCENIVFFGDGKNQPYGNRSREEILCMTRQDVYKRQSL